MKVRKINRLTMGGMLAALVAVFTAYVSVPIAGGYFHPGDAMIALSAIVLGPYAAIPAAIGSGLADLLAARLPLYRKLCDKEIAFSDSEQVAHEIMIPLLT